MKPVSSDDLKKAQDLAGKIQGSPGLDNPATLKQKVKANIGSVGLSPDKADELIGLVQATLAQNKGGLIGEETQPGENAPGLKDWDVAYRSHPPGRGLRWYTVQAETFSDACKIARRRFSREPYAGPLLKRAVDESIDSSAFAAFIDRPEVRAVFLKMAEFLGFQDGTEDLLYRPLALDGTVTRPKGRTQRGFNPNWWSDIAIMARQFFEVRQDDDTFTISIKR